jgi:glycosyltransferase involved in cell wall biosynthesis
MTLSTHYPRISEFHTLEELRAFHNERFIRLAYRSLLGREVDPDGLAHYLAHLRKTISPKDMLAELRCSLESNARLDNSQEIGDLNKSRSRLKVLLCNERFLFRFGVDRVLLLLGEGLKQRGHTISVMANRVDLKPIEAFAEKIIEVPPGEDGGYLNLNEFTAEWLKEELPKIFSNDEWPDIVVIGGWPFFAAIPLFRSHGAKVIFLDCGAVPLEGMEGGQLITQEKLRAMRKAFLPKSNQIIAISKFIEETQSRQDAGKESNTTSIYLGADHMEFGLWSDDTVENACSNLTTIRKAKETGYKIILNLGRWEAGNYKNSLALFDLIKRVCKEISGVVVFVLSDGSDMAIPDELKSHIIPIGYPSDEELREIMSLADAGVSVSLWEGFNLPLAEMQWLGKPVVVFNIGAHPEVVAHPWFLAEDMAQMSGKLIACLQNKGLQQVDHQCAIERFRTGFRWEQVVDRYEQVLLSLLSTSAGTEYSYFQVLVDVTNSAHDPANSGVIRVTRCLCRALQAWCKPIFVLWDQSINSYVFPTVAEYAQLGAFNGPEKLEYHAVSPDYNRIKFTDTFTSGGNPGKGWLLLPETTMEINGKKIRAFAQSLGLQVGVVFYDAIPLIRPDLCKDKAILENHSDYMGGLAECDVIFPISDFSGQCLANYWYEKNIPATTILPVLLPGEFSAGSRLTLPSLFDSNRVNILCVSTIEPRKNHRTLLDALNLLSEKHPDIDWSLTLVGNRYAGGDDLAYMIEAACAQSFRIRWLGIADDRTLRGLYETCSFTVYPSFIEGYGMPIVESLWHGKPCICHEQGVMSELAKDGGCFTTDVLNAEKLSEAIYRLATDRVTYDQLSQQAIARTIKNWEEYSQEMLSHMNKQAKSIQNNKA